MGGKRRHYTCDMALFFIGLLLYVGGKALLRHPSIAVWLDEPVICRKCRARRRTCACGPPIV
jgi:hypothetical protein